MDGLNAINAFDDAFAGFDDAAQGFGGFDDGAMQGKANGKGQDPNKFFAQDYKFLGFVKSYDEKKQHGMIECAESAAIWGGDVYAHKMVLATASLSVGDTLRFGVHVNPRGQPQASLPVYKVGVDGQPIGVKENDIVKNAEEYAAMDPGFLVKLGEEIGKRSKQQNENRGKKRMFEQVAGSAWGNWGAGAAWGGGGGGAGGAGAWGFGMDSMGASGGGKGGAGGCGGWSGGGGVDLFVGGVPTDATSRELHHIFRQYAGFLSLRVIQKERMLVFVTFATPAQAQFVADALTGYVFDQDSPDQTVISVEVSRGKGKKPGK